MDASLNEPGPSRRTNIHTPNTVERKVTRAVTKQNNCEQLEMRKRKLANCQNSEPERQDVAKKPFLLSNRKRTESNETNSPVKKKISIEQPCSSPNRQSQIPRLTQTQNKPNHQTKPKIPTIQDWLSIYQVPTPYLYIVNLTKIDFSLGLIKIRKMLSTNLSKWHIQIMSDI